MTLTQRHVEIIWELYRRDLDLAKGNDDQRRQLTRKIAEQINFEFGPRWGTKSTTVNHPPSKDAIVYKNDNGTVDIWDWQNGDSRQPQVHEGKAADYKNMDHFFLKVDAVNHLGSVVVNPPVVPPTGPPSTNPPSNPPVDESDIKKILLALENAKENLADVRVQMSAIQGLVGEMKYMLDVIKNQPFPDIKWPVYESNKVSFLGTITLTPKGKK